MICYEDKTWCNAHKCTYYTVCKEALPYAKKIQQKQEGCQWLPYAVRDMSDDCNDYEVEVAEWNQRHHRLNTQQTYCGNLGTMLQIMTSTK